MSRPFNVRLEVIRIERERIRLLRRFVMCIRGMLLCCVALFVAVAIDCFLKFTG